MVFKNRLYTVGILLILSSTILTLTPDLNQTKAQGYPSSIIIFIGDGMGLEQVKFGSLVEFGNDSFTSIFNFPYNTTISTNNIDEGTTDSAASATAISTGIKTKNGRISVNYDGTMELTTILEIAQMNGYATGIVATCHLTHATPAAFAAHDTSRYNY